MDGILGECRSFPLISGHLSRVDGGLWGWNGWVLGAIAGVLAGWREDLAGRCSAWIWALDSRFRGNDGSGAGMTAEAGMTVVEVGMTVEAGMTVVEVGMTVEAGMTVVGPE